MTRNLPKGVRAKWRDFLDTPEGSSALYFLRLNAPSVNKGQPHEVIYDGAFKEGFLRALDKIEELAEEPVADLDTENK